MKKSTDDLLAEFTDMLNEDRTQLELEAFIGRNDQDREFVHLARTAWRLNQGFHKQLGTCPICGQSSHSFDCR